MTDIFREVEEEVRRERLEKIWKQYGDYIIAAVAVIVIVIAGFELWQRYEQNRRETASAQYNAAVQLAANNPAAAITAFEKIATTAPAGYATLAKFAEADTLLVTGDRKKAVSIYETIGSGDDHLIASAARMRAAWSIVGFSPRSAIEKLVEPLTEPNSPWRFVAREVLAYADYREGAYAKAQKEFAALSFDTAAPRALRTRAGAMDSLIRGGGENNFGYVPPAPPPSTSPNNSLGQAQTPQ